MHPRLLIKAGRVVFLLPGVLVFFVLCVALEGNAGNITVHGIGYPPIKTVSKSQALLMAKRAAILDAYSRIAWRTGETHEEHFFMHFSGFVRNMEIMQEEFLPDGGVRVSVRMKRNNALLSAHKTPAVEKSKTSTSGKSAPRQVSRKEWFQIISTMVSFEADEIREENNNEKL